jgi:hypothetical protein
MCNYVVGGVWWGRWKEGIITMDACVHIFEEKALPSRNSGCSWGHIALTCFPLLISEILVFHAIKIEIFGNLKKNLINAESIKVLTKISMYYGIPKNYMFGYVFAWWPMHPYLITGSFETLDH